MDLSWKRKISLSSLVLFSALALTGQSCLPGGSSSAPLSDIAIVVWGLWNDSSDLDPVIASFTETTGVSVEYRKIASVADYERRLLEAFAEGRGPDVFVIHHTWVEGKRGLMTPAPASVIDERALREEFVDVVPQDVLREGQIYALPTSVDTLALYYNKDIFDSSAIARPPRTWQEFQQVVERLTSVSRFGTIEQSAASLGTAANINRATDILQLLLLQSGVDIINTDGGIAITGDSAERSLTFYTDFANRSKKVYTWDLQQSYSLDAFSEGETAMMLNYSYHLPTIKAKSPRLNFAIAPTPQIADSRTVNFASYWPFAVSRQSQHPELAWQFIRQLTGAAGSEAINTAAQTPPARRDQIAAFARDPQLGVFTEQTLTAISWPRVDIVAIDAIINAMIDSVVTGAATVPESLRRAEGQLNQISTEVEIDQSGSGSSGENLGPGDIGLF